MMRKFLERCDFATSLDQKKFDRLFTHGLKRSDFSLFEREVICESKEVQALDVEKQVAKLWAKGPLPTDVFNRYFCNSVINDLDKAEKQIADTKIALGCAEALGLVVLENFIPGKMSTLTLLSAANQRMLEALPSIDGVLCLDVINYFKSSEGEAIRFCQLLLRNTDSSLRLSERVQVIVREFCDDLGVPFKDGFTLERADQRWHARLNGTFEDYKASMTFK
jgi:hypothetical protein